MEHCKNYFLKLNIFQTSSASHQEGNEDLYEQHTQLVATRVYLILLILILIIFLLFTCLNSETITMTIQNPTLAQIQSLPANRICPCSRISFSYDKFVSNNVSFHQVCSSDFVSNRWISSLFYGINASYFLETDFVPLASLNFKHWPVFVNCHERMSIKLFHSLDQRHSSVRTLIVHQQIFALKS